VKDRINIMTLDRRDGVKIEGGKERGGRGKGKGQSKYDIKTLLRQER
jgi:hypothetical protein